MAVPQATTVSASEQLNSHLDSCRAALAARGYTPSSIGHHLDRTVHLGRWLDERSLDLGGFTSERVEEYFESRRQEGHKEWLTTRGFGTVLAHLRDLGLVPNPEPVLPASPVEELLASYHTYLLSERGLEVRTTAGYLRVAREFLDRQAALGRPGPHDLSTADVTGFVVREVAEGRNLKAKNMVPALRSWLRFLYLEGHTAVDLKAAVPAVAGQRWAALPLGIEPDEVARLLATCDRTQAVGRRDYAVLMLLSRLGLRTAEVARLELTDINWPSGDLVVHGKGDRDERLPLPVDVGEALVDYMHFGRPNSIASPAVFMQAKAPPGRLTRTDVTDVVGRAWIRAGLPRRNSRRLRHGVATEMLRRGAGLGEVGQVLRHRSPMTTSLYAKVDQNALTVLARPWPEVRP